MCPLTRPGQVLLNVCWRPYSLQALCWRVIWWGSTYSDMVSYRRSTGLGMEGPNVLDTVARATTPFLCSVKYYREVKSVTISLLCVIVYILKLQWKHIFPLVKMVCKAFLPPQDPSSNLDIVIFLSFQFLISDLLCLWKKIAIKNLNRGPHIWKTMNKLTDQ